MLGINGLDAADFLKEVLITLEDKNNFLIEEFGQKTIYVRNPLSWLSAGIKRFNFQLISMTTEGKIHCQWLSEKTDMTTTDNEK